MLSSIRSRRAGAVSVIELATVEYLCILIISGLLAMCVGEKRKLVIPADLGYGDTGAGDKIPGGATLVFEVELVNIDRKSEL